MLTIALLGGGLLLFAAVVRAASRASRQRREMIASVLREMGATEVQARSFGLNAVVRGMPIRWDMVDAGRGRPMHTICSVSLPHPPRFLMELRRQTGEELEQVRAGRAVDVIVGDPAFDDAFIVEAAPSDVAKKLLDPETRRMLLAMRPLRLCVTQSTLWLDVVGVVAHAAIVASMIELVLALARRLGELPLAMAEERMSAEAREAGGAGYRGPTPGGGGAVDTWSPQAETELAALVVARKHRGQRKWVTLAAVVAAWLTLSLSVTRCIQR